MKNLSTKEIVIVYGGTQCSGVIIEDGNIKQFITDRTIDDRGNQGKAECMQLVCGYQQPNTYYFGYTEGALFGLSPC